jgi:hypothetical protein
MTDIAARPASRIVSAVALVWGGLLAGVSFLATPVKFVAPSLALPVALDVGRVTFSALNRVEIGAAVVLIGLVFLTARSALNLAGALVLAGLVLVQAFWLLPALDARVATIMAGGTPPESGLHVAYIAIEGTKLVILLAVGALNLRARP